MWHKPCRTFHPWCPCIKTRCLSYSLKHISTREHSLHISWRSTHLLHLYFLFSWWRHQMETCSTSLAFVQGNSPVTAGNSPVIGALMLSLICARTNGWGNNQDAGDLRRQRAHYYVTVMWCRIVIQWSGQPWDLPAFNASLGGGGGVPGIMEGMASNLAHCFTLITIPWN